MTGPSPKSREKFVQALEQQANSINDTIKQAYIINERYPVYDVNTMKYRMKKIKDLEKSLTFRLASLRILIKQIKHGHAWVRLK